MDGSGINPVRNARGVTPLPPSPPAPGGSAGGRDTAVSVVTLRGAAARITRRDLLRKGIAFRIAANESIAVNARLVGAARSATLSAVRDLTVAQRSLPLALRLVFHHEFRGIRLKQIVKSEASRLLLHQQAATRQNLKQVPRRL